MILKPFKLVLVGFKVVLGRKIPGMCFSGKKSPRQGCTIQKTELGMQIHPNPSKFIQIDSKSMNIYWNPLKSIDLGIIWSKIAPLRLDPLPWLWVSLLLMSVLYHIHWFVVFKNLMCLVWCTIFHPSSLPWNCWSRCDVQGTLTDSGIVMVDGGLIFLFLLIFNRFCWKWGFRCIPSSVFGLVQPCRFYFYEKNITF